MIMAYDNRIWIKSYDEHIDPDMAIPDRSFAALMDEIFLKYPGQAACHFMGSTMTYAQLDLASRKFAAFLKDAGLEKGDVVAINMPNIPQYLVALIGTVRAGCVKTGVSPLLTSKEMANQLNDSGAKVIVTLDAILEHRLTEVADMIPECTHMVGTNLGEHMPMVKRALGKLLKKVPSGNIGPVEGKTVTSLKDILKNYNAEKNDVEISADDLCLIQYTGGTTGQPKGAELTHRNVVAATSMLLQWCGLNKGEDVFLTGFPLFHIGGLFLGMGFLLCACPQILIPDPRNTKHIIGEMAKFKPTGMGNVPSLYQMLLDEPDFKKLPFAHMKGFVSGAAPFSTETLNEMEAVVGKGKISDVYGMTESCALVAMIPFYGKKKPGSVGVPMQNTIVKLVDLDKGTTEVSEGEPGEIIVSGPQVMQGYHNKPDETANTLREYDGVKWLHTGDIAVMDEEGYLTIVDRSKDMINVSGYKVFSCEVEEKLAGHPAIEFSALIGVVDKERLGNEQVKAVIQLKNDYKGREQEELKQEIVTFCKDNMAPYKIPKIIEFVDEMPLTTVGKVDKKALRG